MAAATTRPPAPASTKLVYDFSEGSREMRDLLGGKGANVAEMTRILGAELRPRRASRSRPRRASRTCAPDASRPTGLDDAGRRGARAAGGARRQAARRPGRPAARLGALRRARLDARACSTRSSTSGSTTRRSRASRARTGNERFAWDSYRRFVQMFGNVVRGIPGERFEDAIAARQARARRHARHRPRRRRAARARRARFQRRSTTSPADPREQLEQAIRAVFDSWMGDARRRVPAASTASPTTGARRSTSSRWSSATRARRSGSGVAFSRDEVTGAPEPERRLPRRTPRARTSSPACARRATSPSSTAWMPEVHAQLLEILRTLERHYGDMQDTEFTIEDGRLYMLQTRNAKRPAQAAVRFAVDAVDGGPADQGAGDRDDRRRQARRAAAPDVRPGRRVRGARARRRRLAGRGQGRDRLHRRRRGRRGRRGPAT